MTARLLVFDPTNQLIFYGPARDALQSGQVGDLAIVYGCPLVVE